MTIDGRSWRADAAPHPTSELTAIHYLARAAERYLLGPTGTGQVAALFGEHGSGKTHAILHAMRQAESDATPPHQIYLKVEGPDFLAVHRRLMQHVPYEVFEDLSYSLLAWACAETIPEGEPIDRTRVARRLQADRSIHDLFRRYAIDRGAVYDCQASEVRRVTGGGLDFVRAMRFAVDSHLGPHAHRWLSGAEVGIDELRKLGVSGPITRPDVAKLALLLTAALFRRAGRRLFIYVDQIEKLVLRAGYLDPDSTGILHTLVERVPDEGAMLVVAGNLETWDALPRDLRDRFGRNHLELKALTSDEAQQLVDSYQETGCDGPLSPTAIESSLSGAGGNTRKFLELCSQRYDDEGWQRRLQANDDLPNEPGPRPAGRDRHGVDEWYQ